MVPTDVNDEARVRAVALDQSTADGAVKDGRMCARRDLPHLLALVKDRRALTGDAAAFEGEVDETAGDACTLLVFEHGAPDEVLALGELDRPGKTRLKR